MDEERVVDMVQLLNETIVGANEELTDVNANSEDRKRALEAFERLYKLRIEELKVGNDFLNSEEDRKLRQIEIEEQRALSKSENWKTWIEVGKAGAALTAWIFVSFAVMRFEETGSIRTKAFAGTIPKLKFW